MIHLLPLTAVVGMQNQMIQDVPIEKKPRASPNNKYSDTVLSFDAIMLNLEKEFTGTKKKVEPLACFGFEQVEIRSTQMMDTASDLEIIIPQIHTKDKRLDSQNAFGNSLHTKEVLLSMSTKPTSDMTSVAVTIPNLALYAVFDFWIDVSDVLFLPFVG